MILHFQVYAKKKKFENRDPNRYLYPHVHSGIIHNSHQMKQPNCPETE